jgi:hypothetical protein
MSVLPTSRPAATASRRCSVALPADRWVRVGDRAEPVVGILEEVGVDRFGAQIRLAQLVAEFAPVLGRVPGQVEREPERRAGVLPNEGGVLEALGQRAGLAEHGQLGEAGAGGAEAPGRDLDLLAAAP